MGLYFSGNETLQEIVSPRMPQMHPDSGREFGLLENLQNLVLLVMVGVALGAARRKTPKWEKGLFAAIAAFALFVFLEEIDYGLHFYEYLRGIPWNRAVKARNVHNVGNRTQVAKQVVDVAMVIFFVIGPVVFARSTRPWIRYFTPDRYSVLTMVAMGIVHVSAHGLRDWGVGSEGTIHKNLSEFRELVTYYLFLLYLIEVGLRRTFGDSGEE